VIVLSTRPVKDAGIAITNSIAVSREKRSVPLHHRATALAARCFLPTVDFPRLFALIRGAASRYDAKRAKVGARD
jgi:hypothetical protein